MKRKRSMSRSDFGAAEGSEISQGCRIKNKYKYWIQFDPTRHKFLVTMGGDFKNQLEIPRKFRKNFIVKLSNTIRLRGPSGHVWAVKLKQTSDEWLLQSGWESFVQDHHLADEDFLVFHYEGNSSFNVTIFNKKRCEQEGSYFIKEHTNSCSGYCSAVPNIGKDASSENVIRLDESEEEETQKRELSRGRGNQTENGTTSNDSVADNSENAKSRGNQASTEWIPKEAKYNVMVLSNRRQVTAREMQRARTLATQHKTTNPSFMLVMKPTNVHKGFTVTMPKEWATKHMPNEDYMEIQIRDPPSKKKWPVKWSYNNRRNYFLSRGWYKFVLDNNLEEHDVCVFELKGGGKMSKQVVVLDVTIFRVVDEIVPLTYSPAAKHQNLW